MNKFLSLALVVALFSCVSCDDLSDYPIKEEVCENFGECLTDCVKKLPPNRQFTEILDCSDACALTHCKEIDVTPELAGTQKSQYTPPPPAAPQQQQHQAPPQQQQAPPQQQQQQQQQQAPPQQQQQAPQSLYVAEKSMAEIQPGTLGEVVLFYKGGEAASIAAVTAQDQAAQALQGSGVKFVKVDYYKNQAAVDGAGIPADQLPWLFVAVDIFERYTGQMTGPAVQQFIGAQLEAITANDVYGFASEEILLSQPTPNFVKFFEESCTVCKSIQNNFMRSATKHRGKVSFVEVDCNSAQGRPFCQKQQVTAYPTFKLFFPGGRSVNYDGLRNPVDFANFIGQATGGHTEL